MKHTIITLCLVISCLFASAQSFEGEIIYKNTYKSKDPTITDQKFTAMMGSQQNYYIKDGDYRSETNGNLMFWQLYINADNMLYSKFVNSEQILWNNASINNDKVIGSVLHKNADVILGYECDELILTCKSGIQKYYFSSKLPVDSRLFINHKYGNWHTYLLKANAVPLKMVLDNEKFTLESVATAVKPMVLDKKMFALPVGAKTAKSPY